MYTKGATTDDGGTASEDKLVVACTPGKAYVRGYEIEKLRSHLKIYKKQEMLKPSMLVLRI